MRPRRREQQVEERDERAGVPGAPPPADPAILGLQRTAGNAAVSRMLARQPSPDGPVAEAAPAPSQGLPGFSAGGSLSDIAATYTSAMHKVGDWFDQTLLDLQKEGIFVFGESMPELIDRARGLEFVTAAGRRMKVADAAGVSNGDIEVLIRQKARARGFRLLEHHALTDPAGAQKEALAALRNLGAKIPTELTFGGDGAKVTVSISGTVTAEVKAGKVEIEAEGSAGEGKATAKFPGGKASVQASEKGVKGKLDLGDLIKVDGGVERKGEEWEWKARIEVGTLGGSVASPEDIAKVIKGAQTAFTDGARQLAQGVDPAKLKTHGGEIAEAVQKVAEKAQKSAKQGSKPGWGIGASVSGSSSGGVTGTITFTWVF